MECVNKNIPTRTLKDYYIDNKEKILNTSMKRFERYKNENFECECGAVVRYLGKSRHKKQYCKLSKSLIPVTNNQYNFNMPTLQYLLHDHLYMLNVTVTLPWLLNKWEKRLNRFFSFG
jgi:hypothetical protein